MFDKRTLLVALLLFGSGGAGRVWAKDKAPPRIFKYAAWKEVESFSAQATAIDHGWAKNANAQEWVDNDHYMAVRYVFDLRRTVPAGAAASNAWFWDVQNCMAQGDVQYHSRGGAFLRKSDHHYTGSLNGAVIKGGALRIDFETGEWAVITEGLLEKPFREAGHSHYELNGRVDDTDIDQKDNKIPGISIKGKLDAATKPAVLAGTGIVDQTSAGGGRSVREYRVVMWPNYRDVECVVEIDQYEQWLPAANITLPNLPGSRLHVNAYLRPKGGGTNTRLHARRFRFELSDTSHEPGVAMNYPQLVAQDNQAAPDDPLVDLRLALHGETGELHNDGQQADANPFVNLRGQDSASVYVDAFDFGGHANLKVICELEDGRELPGILHSAKGGEVVDITVPKRSDGSKIADVWREKYKIGPNDAEDDEQDPVGDGNRGDGFSNYEEYRGFVINGKHVRTDPTRKDLFIRNRIGPAAEDGLFLFMQDTGLKVHFKCKPGDMPLSRVMNANRSAKSPRSTQEFQHGLVLTYQMSGDYSIAESDAELCRPKNVKEVRILRSLVFPPGNPRLSEDDKTELASTITHELCHAIGCKHHGETDLKDVGWVRKSRVVGGKTEWWFKERKAEWDDAQGKYVPSAEPGYEIRIFASPTQEILAADPGKMKFPRIVWVGVNGGQHSGSDKCVMRYDCADAYMLPGQPRIRYLSPGEPTGMELCDSDIGTGINDPDAKPPRYGNGVTADCIHRFAVRDDAPERVPGK